MHKYIVFYLPFLFINFIISQEAFSEPKTLELLKKQQEEILELQNKLKENSEMTEALIESVEENKNLGSSSSNKNTQIGGYGELHYNGGKKDEIDFHRFVFMLQHQFNEKFSLFTEVELEHALSGEGKDGEVELEQAYIEYAIKEEQKLRAGLFLLPIAGLNLIHEPTTFFGVERNPVEKAIIPTTWWEAGVGVSGDILENLSYDLSFHSGLNVATEGDNVFNIRSGRQKVSEATAKDGASTLALKWQPANGVSFSFSGQYQKDISQDQLDDDVSAILLAASSDIRKGPFGFKALVADWSIDGSLAELTGHDKQQGWFVEPSYYIDSSVGQFGVFARYNSFDTQAGDSSLNSGTEQYDLGLNYWPHPRVVLKADMAFVRAEEDEQDDNILNLGIGFEY